MSLLNHSVRRFSCAIALLCVVNPAHSQDARKAHRFQAILNVPDHISFDPPEAPIDPTGPNPSDPNVAVIEFNESGELWRPCKGDTFIKSRCQPNFAAEFIQQARRDVGDGHKLVVLTFVHGWRHNSLWDDANFTNFREAIDCLNWGEKKYADAYSEVLADAVTTKANAKSKKELPDWDHLTCKGVQQSSNLRYVGVYIGWQGTTPNLEDGVFTLTSRYPVAKATAAGKDMLSVFNQIRDAAKGTSGQNSGPIARLIFMGHSFGALIVERTAEKILTPTYLSQTSACPTNTSSGPSTNPATSSSVGAKPWTELFVLINNANTSATGIGLITSFKAATFCPSTVTAKNLPAPWIVSIHSDSDVFTGKVGTVGRKILGLESAYAGPSVPATSGSIRSPKNGLLETSTLNNSVFFLNSCYIDSSTIRKNSKTGDLLCDRIDQQIAAAKIAAFNQNHLEDLTLSDPANLGRLKAERGAFDLVTEPCGPTPLRATAPPCTDDLLSKRDNRWKVLNAALAPYFSMPITATDGNPNHLLNLYNRTDIGCFRKNQAPAFPDQPLCLRDEKYQPVPPQQRPWNDTPYWAFNVTDQVISGHDGFWTDRLTDLLNSILLNVPDVQ